MAVALKSGGFIGDQSWSFGRAGASCLFIAARFLFFVGIDTDPCARINLSDIQLISIASAGLQRCHLATASARWAGDFLFLDRAGINRQLQYHLTAVRAGKVDIFLIVQRG